MKKLLMLFMVLLMSCSTDNGLSVEEVTVYDTVTVENEIDVEIKKEVEKLVNVYDTFPTGKLVEIFDTTEIKIKRYVYDTIKVDDSNIDNIDNIDTIIVDKIDTISNTYLINDVDNEIMYYMGNYNYRDLTTAFNAKNIDVEYIQLIDFLQYETDEIKESTEDDYIIISYDMNGDTYTDENYNLFKVLDLSIMHKFVTNIVFYHIDDENTIYDISFEEY